MSEGGLYFGCRDKFLLEQGKFLRVSDRGYVLDLSRTFYYCGKDISLAWVGLVDCMSAFERDDAVEWV